MKKFKGGYRENQYKGRTIQQRINFRRRLTTGLKLMFGIACIVLLSTIYLIGYGVVTQCDYFKAKKIEITGTDKLVEEDVLKQASLYPGINILLVNLSASRKRLLAHPEIEDADIIRTYPDGLRIRIKEHRPLAIVDLGREFLMNEHGKIYREWRKTDTYVLPRVQGLKFSDFTGDNISQGKPYIAVMNVLRIGEDPLSILPNAMIRKIRVDREMGVTLYADDCMREIKLGYGGFPDKYKRLKKVAMYLKTRHRVTDFESIDLMNADRIVVSPMEIKRAEKKEKEV